MMAASWRRHLMRGQKLRLLQTSIIDASSRTGPRCYGRGASGRRLAGLASGQLDFSRAKAPSAAFLCRVYTHHRGRELGRARGMAYAPLYMMGEELAWRRGGDCLLVLARHGGRHLGLSRRLICLAKPIFDAKIIGGLSHSAGVKKMRRSGAYGIVAWRFLFPTNSSGIMPVKWQNLYEYIAPRQRLPSREGGC